MKYKGEILVIMSAAGFALMPDFAKLAYSGGANVETVLAFRFIFAVFFIWSFIFLKGFNFKIKPKQILMCAMQGGILYSGSALTLFRSYKYISAGLSEVLMFTYPAMVLIISFIIFKEKLETNKIYAICLSIIGVTLVAYVPGQAFNFIGILLALAGALFYAFYVALLNHGDFEEIHPAVLSGYVILFASIVFISMAFINKRFAIDFRPVSWIYLVCLGFFSSAMAILTFCSGARLIGSSRASIISTIEPVIAIFFGSIFLNEKILFNTLMGAVIIIMAILAIHLFNTR